MARRKKKSVVADECQAPHECVAPDCDCKQMGAGWHECKGDDCECKQPPIQSVSQIVEESNLEASEEVTPQKEELKPMSKAKAPSRYSKFGG